MKKLVNISIDDITPHPKSSTKVLERCYELIKEFPDIKFTLFIPTAYWRTTRREIATEAPLYLNLFPDFCKEIANLPSRNFEIGYHGLFHGIPGKSDNDEFQYLNYLEAIEKIELMEEVATKAHLDKVFKKIFRPPAWRISPFAIKALRDKGYKILALSPKEYALATYQKEQEKANDVVYYNCNPPFDPLVFYDRTEIVYHACEWDKNYFSKALAKDLATFLKSEDDINFSFIEGLIVENKKD